MTSSDPIDPLPFELPVRVYFQDTDAGGVVFHASYLSFFERSRTEWLRSLGLEPVRWSESNGCLVVVRHLEVAYRAPARLDDLLYVGARLVACRQAQFTLQQQVRRGGDVLVDAKVNLACVRQRDLYPMALPDSLKIKLQRMQGENK